MQVCQYCGHEGDLVWVHGHGQCAQCGINVAPCCDGVVCDEATEPARKPRQQMTTERPKQASQVRKWQNRQSG